MQTQEHLHEAQQQKDQTRWFAHRPARIVAFVTMTLMVMVVWILSILGVIAAVWAAILTAIFAVLGGVAALWPLLFPKTSETISQPPSLVQHHYHGIVGLPPPIDPKTIQQREGIVKEIYALLIQLDTTCVAFTGIGGVGKSTLAALIYHYTKTQRRSNGSPFATAPLWLTIDPSVTMTDLVGNLFAVLGKDLPDMTHLSPQSQAAMLFNALDTMSQARLVILDQFENLLDPQTGSELPTRPGVGEWLDALNSQQFAQSGCRILLTSRLYPKGIRYYASLYMKEYEIRGLEMIEGIELLRKQGVVAAEADLREAVKRCDGHALALTLLAALLRRNPSLTLAVLLNDPLYATFWTGDIARNLLDYLYNQQLNDAQRMLLLAFSVYREPVPLEAAQTAMEQHGRIPKAQLQVSLEALLAQHLLIATGEGRYRLHAIVTNYAQEHFDERDDTTNLRVKQATHAQAAQYYLQRAKAAVPAREKRRSISDIHDLTEAAWHLCQAEQQQAAYDLMQREGIFADLRRWGGNVVLLELCQLLLPDKWHPEPAQQAYIYNHLGRLYDDLGKTGEALAAYEHVLSISRHISDHTREGVALNNLGRIYKEQGKTDEACAYFEQALVACQAGNDRGGEGTTLNNLGPVYAALGRTDEARHCLEQALSIFRGEAKYHAGAARALNSLGRLSADLGEKEQARGYYEQALSAYQDADDQRGVGNVLNNLGNISAELGQPEQAGQYLEQALSVRKELGNRWAEATTLNDLGKVCGTLGENQAARDNYWKALSIFREEKARREEGKTLLNLGILYFDQGHNDIALACFLLSKSIFKEGGNLGGEEIQQRIDDLHAKVGDGEFEGLIAQVEPRAEQLVEQELRGNIPRNSH